jgi:methionyl-tRNA synthetase
MSRFFISTAIPYVNANPHIGFALELVQADAVARYHRMLGDEVLFVTGTDENALKNVQSAEKAGEPVKEFVERHAQIFAELTRVLHISNDDFIRTTEERHVIGAQKLWKACLDAGDIYKKKYTGLYCTGCEAFITPKELIDGLCPEHKTKPQEIEEENYFFRLSKYQDKLAELISLDRLTIIPVGRKNEMLEFIKQGLEDFSISRSQERAKHWGIPVPDDPSQVMYVWFDALTNYINVLGYGAGDKKFNQYWSGNDQIVHLIGKGITRFHAIYWPAMLLSAGLIPPKRILVHGYVNVEGEKMSKSLGNVVDPFEVSERYGAETVRYFLLREFSSIEDGDFTYKALESRYNSDLANGLGNLVQRVATLLESKMNSEAVYRSNLESTEPMLAQVLDDTAYHNAFEQFRLHDVAANVWAKIALANVYLNEKEPWKAGEEQHQTLIVSAAMIVHIARLLQPLMPETAQKVADIYGASLAQDLTDGQTIKIKKGEVMFPRR